MTVRKGLLEKTIIAVRYYMAYHYMYMENNFTVNGSEYVLTKHALHRANKRNITIEDIIDALLTPKSRYVQKQIKGRPTKIVIMGRNKVQLVLDSTERIIISMMRYNQKFHESKSKERKNKDRLDLKRKYGNRYKDKRKRLKK